MLLAALDIPATTTGLAPTAAVRTGDAIPCSLTGVSYEDAA